MNRVLIAGIETVVGANLAATLIDDFHVVGLSHSGSLPLAACETMTCGSCDADALRSHAAGLGPDWIVCCGPSAVSHWDDRSHGRIDDAVVESTRILSDIAQNLNCRFAFISSDAVFTGPWMFHSEGCSGYCPSEKATMIRNAEQVALRNCPNSLVIRTNCYGWSPASRAGWIENTLAALADGKHVSFDGVRHSSPILATDLAEILLRAFRAELAGTFHIAGAERISPARFVDLLADTFDLPAPRHDSATSLVERPTGFGRGETSLQTRKIRSALGVSLPLVHAGIARLRTQQVSGYCDLLAAGRMSLRDKVA